MGRAHMLDRTAAKMFDTLLQDATIEIGAIDKKYTHEMPLDLKRF